MREPDPGEDGMLEGKCMDRQKVSLGCWRRGRRNGRKRAQEIGMIRVLTGMIDVTTGEGVSNKLYWSGIEYEKKRGPAMIGHGHGPVCYKSRAWRVKKKTNVLVEDHLRPTIAV